LQQAVGFLRIPLLEKISSLNAGDAIEAFRGSEPGKCHENLRRSIASESEPQFREMKGEFLCADYSTI